MTANVTARLFLVSLLTALGLACAQRSTEERESEDTEEVKQGASCVGDHLSFDDEALNAIRQLRSGDAPVGLSGRGCKLATVNCEKLDWSQYEYVPLTLPHPEASGAVYLAGGYSSHALGEGGGRVECTGLTHIVTEVLVGCSTDEAATCGVCCGEYDDPAMNFYCSEPVSVGIVDVSSSAVRMVSVVPSKSPARGQAASASVLIPGGEQDGVSIAPFYIDKTEVTARAYRECVSAGVCRPTRRAGTCNEADDERLDHPINCVTWCDARAYCEWVGGRLPTAVEWEWVATGRGEQRKYPWGDASPSCERVIYFDEQYGKLAGCDVGSTSAVDARPSGGSRDGVLGLAGNVSEWTADGEGRQRVMRGGSWLDQAKFLGIGARGVMAMETAYDFSGFRCVADP